MQAEDYIKLPDRIDSSVFVELPPAKLKSYKDFERESILELEDSDDVEAVNAAVLGNKLLQFANGAIYTDAVGNWSDLHRVKLEALNDIIEDNAGENILIAYNYKTDLARLKKKFPDAVVMDKDGEAVARWNNNEIKLLLAHPASAGHGLNLQKGGSLIVWFGMIWSLELYQQFNARLHRQGQTKPCRVVHIVASQTIDEKVLTVLSDKNAVQNNLLTALK
jgi:SNF2 family DNA or RNA helicase